MPGALQQAVTHPDITRLPRPQLWERGAHRAQYSHARPVEIAPEVHRQVNAECAEPYFEQLPVSTVEFPTLRVIDGYALGCSQSLGTALESGCEHERQSVEDS